MTSPPTPTTPLHQAASLRSVEDELARLCGRIRTVAAFIHDSTYNLTARQALAQRLGLPEPTPTTAATNATKGTGDPL